MYLCLQRHQADLVDLSIPLDRCIQWDLSIPSDRLDLTDEDKEQQDWDKDQADTDQVATEVVGVRVLEAGNTVKTVVRTPFI